MSMFGLFHQELCLFTFMVCSLAMLGLVPVSSFSSLAAACAASSPSSIKPAGTYICIQCYSVTSNMLVCNAGKLQLLHNNHVNYLHNHCILGGSVLCFKDDLERL